MKKALVSVVAEETPVETEENMEFVITKDNLDIMFGEEAFESQLVKFFQPKEDFNDAKRFVREALISLVKENGGTKKVFVEGNNMFTVSLKFN